MKKKRIFIKKSEVENLASGKPVSRYMRKDRVKVKLIPLTRYR